MGMIEDTRYIAGEIDALCGRLCGEGMDIDLVLACMLDAVADGYAHMDGAELMPDVFRRTADEMEAGERRVANLATLHRPALRIIHGGGEGES